MRNVFTFHNMGSMGLEKYLKWGTQRLYIWPPPLSLASLRMLSPFTANTDLAEVLKSVSSFCFLCPCGVYLSRVKSLQERSFNQQQACWVRWSHSFTEVWKADLFFLSCLITSETLLCFLINSLLPKTNTALENHLIASVLGYMSNLMNISKSHFSSRWPVGVLPSTVILNCLLFLCNILLLKYLEKRLLIVPSSGDCDTFEKYI